MDKSEKEIKKLIVGLSEYLQVVLSVDQIKLYAKEFEVIGPEGLGEAIRRLKADPDVWPGRFPLPAKIISYLYPPIDSEAKKCVAIIFESIQMFGSNNQAKAKMHMGSLAWEVCKQYGGFGNLCNMETHQKPTIYAQLRDMAENTIYRHRNNFGVPQIEDTARKSIVRDQESQKGIAQIGDVLSEILQKDT